MHLKKLELVGFKSFPEKTQFLFNRGMTSIVGPNGCGKSNLLDALRWVLGEQKTSLLRGTKMEEVIFAGTRALKPLGMAEVSLQIENKDGMLPTEYSEILVTRRLFRSGESEYLINKTPCRLKDITDLFADTGIGAHAYAIIQQEMVDAILSDKTEERRFLFEEAAGITRYKHRKRAAERKLAATEQDLVRLQDILSEVTTRVRSLKRQVNKARRYKEVSEELKGWDLYNAKSRFDQLTDKSKELAVRIKTLSDKKMGIEAKLDGQFADIENRHTMLTELESELSEIGGEVFNLSEKAHQLETEISVKREKKENLEKSVLQNRSDIEGLQKRSDVIRKEKAKALTDLQNHESELNNLSSELEKATAIQKQADEEYLRYRSFAEDDNTMLVNIEGRLSSGKADSANIEQQIDELNKELERNSEKKNNLIGEKKHRREEIASTQSRIEAVRTEIESDEQNIEREEKSLEQTIDSADRLRDHLAEASSNFEATQARKKLMTEMIEHYEGFAGGVVAIFEVAGRWLDITGTVADYIHPQPRYRAAIDAALGEMAQYILCSDYETAQEAISYLREKKAGKATFLMTQRLKDSGTRPELTADDKIIDWADNLVKCDERYGGVPGALLGRTVICEDGIAAQEMLDKMPDGYRIVTVSGQVFTNDGYISGGVSEEMSLIGRKDEIEALDKKLKELENRTRQIRNKQAEVTLSVGESRQTISRLNNNLAEDKDNLSELISRLKEEQFKINAAEEIITSIDQQVNLISEKLEQLKRRQYTLALDFNQLDKEKENITSLVQDKKQKSSELEAAASAAEAEVNRVHMAKIELESKRTHIQSQIEYYEEMLKDISGNITQKEDLIEQSEKEIEDLTADFAHGETNLKKAFDRRQEQTQRQNARRLERDELSDQLDNIEQAVKAHRSERDSISDEIHTAQISETELTSRLEQIEDRMRDEYSIDISQLEIESPNAEMNEEEAAAHVEELRGNLRKMGIVNMLALEEFEDQKQRQEFLARQLDDLISAKSTLNSTIQKINQTAKAMFLETINKARDNFKQMYQELFTGGEADVILEDESDPLESRIEIMSRPRGKKPLTISQLSGGERALTAISLLFALYMVKPSPFCFLDEIDAPLDDVNIGRFLKIVKKFSQQTQFIIITHNKISMEAADTLYGVTMEEPGVSKVVAVRFKKDSEDDETFFELHYADEDAAQAG
ncbi:MAG: chromosome segregation protein SMC [candidate division Zixibacteria bacterium]